MAELNIPKPWAFNSDVAEHFAIHVRQSIPGYDEIYRLLTKFVSESRGAELAVLDLGTGTGEAIKALSPCLRDGDHVTGVDCSDEMLLAAQKSSQVSVPADFVNADLCKWDPGDFNVAIVTFTLSFLPAEARGALLTRLRLKAMDAALIFIADKICYHDDVISSVIASEHRAHKLRSGLSETEIIDKAISLKGVQVPWALEEYLSALREAGWQQPHIVHLKTGFFACVAYADAAPFVR